MEWVPGVQRALANTGKTQMIEKASNQWVASFQHREPTCKDQHVDAHTGMRSEVCELVPRLSTNAVSTHNVAALGPIPAHWLLNLLIAVFGASHLLSISLPGLCPHQGGMCAAGGLPLGCNWPEALAQETLHECLLHVGVWLLFAEVGQFAGER